MNPFAPKIASITLVCLLTAGLVGHAPRAEAAEVRRVAERVIPLAAGGRVHVENKNGRITVEGWSRPEVRVQITRHVRAGDNAKAEELMKELRADIEVRNNRVDIVSRFPKRVETIGLWDILGRKIASLQINYVIQVPNETDLILRTSNGEVRARSVSGRVEAATTNGDIRFGKVSGGMTLETTNGEIELSDVSGTASARTTNGSVVAQLRSVPAKGEVELMTTNGNVEVYFPRDIKAALEAMTTNGRVSVAFPLTMAGVTSSKSVRGTINGGGAQVSLTTTNGNVDVRRLGERRP